MIGGEQVLPFAEAADGPVHAEAPRLHTQPAQVLHGVADVGQLPIEYGAQAIRSEDEIAVAEVAVNDGRAGSGRAPLLQPTEGQLERRMRLPESVEHRPPCVHDVALGVEPGHPVERYRVDGRQCFATLARQLRQCRRVLLVAEDLAGNRLALDALDYEVLLVLGDDARHRYPGLGRGPQQGALGHGRGRPARTARIGAHDEVLLGPVGPDGVDRPHGSRCPGR